MSVEENQGRRKEKSKEEKMAGLESRLRKLRGESRYWYWPVNASVVAMETSDREVQSFHTVLLLFETQSMKGIEVSLARVDLGLSAMSRHWSPRSKLKHARLLFRKPGQ